MNTDTVKLLRECNAGIKMGENAIKKVLPHVRSEEMRRSLEITKNTHASLGDETHAMLLDEGGDTKEPHAVARAMSSMKISARMMMGDGDSGIASVMTDGCDMGIKSLSRYLNQYKGASCESKSIAKRLIASEEYLESRMRDHL